MRNKATPILIELLVMILVFALVSAACLQAFVRADKVSRAGEIKDVAVTAVQSAAETVKYCRGDMDKTGQILGAAPNEDGLILSSTSDFYIDISPEQSENALLGTATVTAFSVESDSEIFALRVCWQEVT